MRVLVTGAAGFIGSHLTEACLAAGHEVRAFVHYNSGGRWGWLEHLRGRVGLEVVSGDIRDYDSLLSATKGTQQIFHLAALIGIPYSYVSPLAYVKTNVEGTYNVLQVARELGVSNVVVTSTSETYGSAQYAPMDEKHPMVGQSPYSASKIGADNLAVSYFRSFGLPVKIARPFNVYGPRQSARAIIPSIIIQLLDGRKEIALGNLSPTRDLTFVADTAQGFLEIAKQEKFNGEYVNIGMNHEISVKDLAEKISTLMGVELKIRADDQRVRPGASEVDRLRCENAKLTGSTPWRPKFDLDRGLRETIDWLRGHAHLYKADQYNV